MDQTVHNTVQEVVIKTISKKKKFKKAKWLSEGALKIAEKRRKVKGKGVQIQNIERAHKTHYQKKKKNRHTQPDFKMGRIPE